MPEINETLEWLDNIHSEPKPQPIVFYNNYEELAREIRRLQKYEEAFKRVVSIANEGVGLKASEIKEIERQEVK